MKVRRQFRSRNLQALFMEGIRQGFISGKREGSQHYYLRCPRKGCDFSQPISGSAKDTPREMLNTVSALRRHGFVWEGRGGSRLLHDNKEGPA